MKVVVQGWDGEQPVYNTRFLAFAFHYGYLTTAIAAHRRRQPIASLLKRVQTS